MTLESNIQVEVGLRWTKSRNIDAVFVEKARTQKTEVAAIRRLTRIQEPKLQAALKRAFRKAQRNININQLLTIYRRNPFAIIDAIPWNDIEQDLRIALERDLSKVLEAAGNVSAGRVAARFNARFDITNPKATAWAKTQSSELVQQVTTNSKKAIRRLVSRGFEQGITPQSTAREIRGILLNDARATLGLTDRQALSVLNEHVRLLRSGLDEATAERRAKRFAQKTLNRRTRTIARTETINSASEGQLQMWEQSQQAGHLKPNQRKQWIVTPDDRLDRKICLPMTDQKVLLRESCTTGDGRQVDRPTAHPNCRCAMILVNPAGPGR